MVGVARNYNFLINRALENHFVHVVYHAISKDLRRVEWLVITKEGKRGILQIRYIGVEVCVLELIEVILEAHVELAIVDPSVISLFSK